MKKKIQNIRKNLLHGSIPSVILNIIWHFSSTTQCNIIERFSGWLMVWFLVSGLVWIVSTSLVYFRSKSVITIPARLKNEM